MATDSGSMDTLDLKLSPSFIRVRVICRYVLAITVFKGASMRKIFVSWLIVVVLLVSSLSGLAQSGGYSEGFEDGRTAAKEDSNAAGQVVGGLFFGLFYIVFSAVSDGQTPGEARMMSIRDESADYQRAYRESYAEQWKRARTNNGWIGFGVWVGIIVVAASS
jgi:hypothetical protein